MHGQKNINSGREVCTTHWTDIWVDFKAVLIVGLIIKFLLLNETSILNYNNT